MRISTAVRFTAVRPALPQLDTGQRWQVVALFRTVWLAAALLTACAPMPEKQAARPIPVFPPPPDEPRFYFERAIYSSADVTEPERNNALRRILTGEGDATGERVTKAYGVAVREGRVYVADSVGGAIKVFDIPGRSYRTFGNSDEGQLLQPLGIDVDAAHNAYVVDASAKVVKVFDRDGKFVRQFGGPKMFSRPTGVGVNAVGDRVYVIDTGGVDRTEEHRVRVFDPRSGAHKFDFGSRGVEEGRFNLARDVAVGPDGAVYVVDGGNFRIQVFDADGKFIRSFGQVGRRPGNFARPREIAVDAESRVYVSDAAFGNFQIFDSKGNILMHVGDRAETDAPARYMLPAGIAVDSDGRVYMADQFFLKIEVFRPASLKPGEGFVAKLPAAGDAKAAELRK